MHTWKRFVMCAVGLSSLALAGCGRDQASKEARNAATEYTQYVDKARHTFETSMKRAEAAAGDDQLAEHFQVLRTIPLYGSSISHLTKLSVDAHGRLVVVDYDRKKIDVFSPTGAFSHSLGAIGRGPGTYTWPSDVAVLPDGRAAVTDLKTNRVNFFDVATGSPTASFLISAQRFSASRIQYSAADDSLTIFGSRYFDDKGRRTELPTLSHRYSAKGAFLESALPYQPADPKVDLTSHLSTMAATDEDGRVYAMLPFAFTVYQRGPGEPIREQRLPAPEYFRPPNGPLVPKHQPKDPLDVFWILNAWKLTWTPIEQIAVWDHTLFVQTQTFNPTRYVLDAWSLHGNTRLWTAHTNKQLLVVGPDGTMYFLDNLDRARQQKYVIHAAALKASVAAEAR